MNIVISRKSLEVISTQASASWISSLGQTGLCGNTIFLIAKKGVLSVYHRDDRMDEQKIFFFGVSGMSKIGDAEIDAAQAIQRAYRLVLSADAAPVRLPTGWSEYHYENMLAFFAVPRASANYRWVAEVGIKSSRDICFWGLYVSQSPIDLPAVKKDYSLYDSGHAAWDAAYEESRGFFSRNAIAQAYVTLDGATDLAEATFASVIHGKTYSQWLEELTSDQREYVEYPIDQSRKLRGPAGTGKTLVLSMKAVREASLEARPKCLFVTHSWAMAEQVDGVVAGLLEIDGVSIHVFPLIEMAKAVLPSSNSKRALPLLGSDSYEGKKEQLKNISSSLELVRSSSFSVYAALVSERLSHRILSVVGSAEWNGFCWDLMHEFSSVITAANILPGITAERRYMALPRAQWMLPLQNDAEKKFVLRVYEEYTRLLKDRGVISVDQLIYDTLSYLETFDWDYRRKNDGYDLIFVDEWHLFSDQERLVINYLMKDPSSSPKIFMALDPRQSPSEIYSDFPISRTSSKDSGLEEELFGVAAATDLSDVYRFSPQILEFVKYIQRNYPIFDLGDDWMLDVSSLNSLAPEGRLPVLQSVENDERELDAIWAMVESARVGDGRVAVVLVDERRLEAVENWLRQKDIRVLRLASRDDIDQLRFQKRSVVVAPAEYVAGLQFDKVIVGGLPFVGERAVSVHESRRWIALLYLAVTRAMRSVSIVQNTDYTDLERLFSGALQEGVIISA